MLPSLVSLAQGAFVHGRQILIGVLIANKHMNSRVKIETLGGCVSLTWRKLMIGQIGDSYSICCAEWVVELDGELGFRSVFTLPTFLF